MNSQLQEKQTFWTRDLKLLASSQLGSTLGDIFYNIAIGFWVFNETGSLELMGIIASVGLFVNMILNPIGGIIVDKLNRKRLLMVGDIMQAVLMISVGFLALYGQLSVTMVIAVAFLVAVAGSFYSPAVLTVMLDLIKKSQIIQAQSSFSGMSNFTRLVGKGLSGVLVISLGIPLMIIVNGFTNLIAASLIYFIKIPIKHNPTIKISIKQVWKDLILGAKLSFTMPGLNVLMICAVLANLFGAGYVQLLLPISLLKGLNEIQFGLFSMSNTVAALLGALFLSAIKIPPKHKRKLFVAAFTFQSIFMIAAFLSIGFIQFTMLFFVGEFLNIIGNTLLSTTLMIASPEDKRATIFGFLSSFAIAGTALSTLAYGFISNYFDIMMIAAVGTFLSVFALSPIFVNPRIKELLESA